MFFALGVSRLGYRIARHMGFERQRQAVSRGWGQLYMKIAAVTGHRYTQGAEQKKLAASALARLTVEQTAHEKSHFGGATPQWGAQPTEKKGLFH